MGAEICTNCKTCHTSGECSPTEIDRLRDRIDRVAELVEGLRIVEHTDRCDDNGYRTARTDPTWRCSCGKVAHDARVDAALALIRGES